MPSTNAERQKRWRLRQAGDLPPAPKCSSCGASHLGAHGVLCQRCWLMTAEGRAYKAARAREQRQALGPEQRRARDRANTAAALRRRRGTRRPPGLD